GRLRHVAVTRAGAAFAITLDGRIWTVDAKRIDAQTLSLLLDKSEDTGAGPSSRVSREVVLVPGGGPGQVTAYVRDEAIPVSLNGHRRWSRGESGVHGSSGPLRITAPMPGKVVRVLVEVGHTVSSRQPLLVVEAMKMENELRASREGTVTEIHAREG